MALAAVACAPSGGGTVARLPGARLEVMAVWTGTEQQRFVEVLDAFRRETGVAVTYTPAPQGMPDALATRVASGQVPDVALLPQPGLLRQYARAGRLVALDAGTVEAVRANYPATWRDLGTVDGRLYGVWFKAANKSLVWYEVGAFERAGVVPPRTLDGLRTVATRLATAGTPSFALGAADGWTLTDWFENVYLRLAGTASYDLLASHRIPWTDGSVRTALATLQELWRPGLIAGSAASALRTPFEDSVRAAFGTARAAAMVVEGDFVQGTVIGDGLGRIGVDVDVFPFPPAHVGDVAVVGGGDAAVVMRDSRAAQALTRFLASPGAAAIWASHGGFVSPNANVDLSVYPDATSRAVARQVVEAGDGFRFDLSDLQPSAFGGVEGQGMFAALQALLQGAGVDATAQRLEADATEAYREK